MGRRKYKREEELLSFPIILRVNEAVFKRLEKLVTESGCQSVGKVARKILSREKILCFYKDVTMNAPMEELKAIGTNINQLTKGFNSAKEDAHKAFYILKVMEQYTPVEAKTDRLLLLVSALAEKWLQK